MKNLKSTKTLMSFAGSAMNLSEMKKVNGGGRFCPKEIGDDTIPFGDLCGNR